MGLLSLATDVINATGLNGVITANAKPNLIAVQPGPNGCQISQPTKAQEQIRQLRQAEAWGLRPITCIAHQQPPGFRTGSRSNRDRLDRLRRGQHPAIRAIA